jgi:hypothetical protein
MSRGDFLEVDPATLRVPGSRRSGADFRKLQRQFSRYGISTDGMPPVEVSRGSDGELIINDGVTRATRIARYAPGVKVPAEVTDTIAVAGSSFPTIRDTL